MKRMWSKNELLRLADAQAKSVQKDIVTLVDAEGHNRFIEGEINIEEITGVTKSYGRWSLSGTHLMIVVACDIDANSTITGVLCNINLPQWVKDKLVIVYPAYYTISIQEAIIRNASTGALVASLTYYLRKENNNVYITFSTGSETPTADALFRIELDLLIDNE